MLREGVPVVHDSEKVTVRPQALQVPFTHIRQTQFRPTEIHSVFSPSIDVRRDPQLIGFLEAYDRPIADLALALREIILEEVPDASESIYQVYTVAIWFGSAKR